MNGTAVTSNGTTNTGGRVLRVWEPPPGGVRPADRTPHEMSHLFSMLPPELSAHLRHHFADRLPNLNEIYLQLGQIPECIFADPQTGATIRQPILDSPCTEAHVQMFAKMFAADDNNGVALTKRRGITGTLHRISLITHPMRMPEKVLGVAVRVGRAMSGLMATMAWRTFLVDLAQRKQSLLLIGRPGVGKTTCLREIARTLADDNRLNVVVVDKTCEIAGDGDEPHPAIGKARWMPVGRPDLQHVLMREAVENQSPDVIIVDEISTPQEVEAARTISQRGVQLIATVHGRTLPEIMACKERGNLIGGVASVTLSGSEAERRYDKRKQVQKRAREPVFTAALELRSRSDWIYHPSIKEAVDGYLEGEPVDAQQLTPGRSTAIAAIPGEGIFEYCSACGGMAGTCPDHRGGHAGGSASEQISNDLSPTALPSFQRSNSTSFGPPPSSFSPSAPMPTPSPSLQNANKTGGTFTFSSSGNNNQNRGGRGRRRRWRAPRGSGRCHKCGEEGHYGRDCPT